MQSFNILSKSPIGVFDSGIGGLTVLKEIMNVLPYEDVVYFGDTARVPYGSRSKETVIKYTKQSINFLKSKGVKAVVIACNTATARSLEVVENLYDIPVIGVINAGVRTAIENTLNQKIGVIGTEGTISSNEYEFQIKKLRPKAHIISKACPLFVPIVEEGWTETQVAFLTAQKYLQEVKDNSVDSLVLGCTHYPLLKNTIQKVMGSKVFLVNPARETAKELKETLRNLDLDNKIHRKGCYSYFVSDDPQKFKKVGERFMETEIEDIELVEIYKY